MVRAVELLIFDWDGTLADSAGQIVGAMQKAIAALDLPPRDDEAIRELIGLGLKEGLQILYPELPTDHVLRLLDGYRAHWLAEGAGESALFVGAQDAVVSLACGGYQIAIATGKSRKGLERSLRHHATLADRLVGSRCADETASKPDPQMLRELLADTGLRPDQALMIGDTEYDMAMARAIGMAGIGVACGVHPRQRLLDGGAAIVLDSVAQLPQWLRQR